MQPGDILNANHAFMAGFMRKPGRAGDVADGIHAGLAGLAKAIHDDMGAVDLHLGAFKADILDIADDADRGDDPVDRDFLRLAAGFDRRR